MEDSFSTALKEARKARGWTQEDLARQLGVSQQSVQKWEAGVSLPRPQRREALTRALGIQTQRAQRVAEYLAAPTAPPEYVPHMAEMAAREVARPFVPSYLRDEALLAEIEISLPDQYRQFLASESRHRKPGGFRFSTDYQSPTVVAQFLKTDTQGGLGGLTTLLYNLATFRQLDIQMADKVRKYLLLVISGNPIKTLTALSNRTLETHLHGIRAIVVHNCQEAADQIADYEEGRPMFDDEPPPEALAPES